LRRGNLQKSDCRHQKAGRRRILIKLAHIAFAAVPMRALIAEAGSEGVPPDQAVPADRDQPGWRIRKAPRDQAARQSPARYYDDGLVRRVDFSPSIPTLSESFEQVLRAFCATKQHPIWRNQMANIGGMQARIAPLKN
jgi:hypothetical protein